MLHLGKCELAVHREGRALVVALAGELTLEWAASAAGEIWMLADASDAALVVLDFRELHRWLPPGVLAALGAFRPVALRRLAWCMLVKPEQLAQGEAVSRAYRSSGDELAVFTSLEAVEAWSLACV